MQTQIVEHVDTTVEEFLEFLLRADAVSVLLHLAGRSAELERTAADGPLETRLAIAIIADGLLRLDAARAHAAEAQDVDYYSLLRRANGLPVRPPGKLLAGQELSEHNCRSVLRMVAHHEAQLGPLKPALARTEILLGGLLGSKLAGRPNPLDAMKPVTGFDYAETRALFLGLYAWAMSKQRSGPPVIARSTLGAMTDPDAAWVRLVGLSRTIDELRALAREKQYATTDPLDFRYAFSPLRDFPFVRIDDAHIVVPVARYAALAFSEGVFDFIEAQVGSADRDAKGTFDSLMGDVAMAYVEERAERELGRGAIRLLPEVKGQLSPDALIGDDCVVEVKAKRLLRGILTTGDITRASHYIHEKVSDAVAQLLSEIARTRADRGRGLSKERLNDVVPCLVTPDGFPAFHLAPVRVWVLAAIKKGLRERHPDLEPEFAALHHFEWLSFDDLDRITAASRLSSTSVGRLLRRFRLEQPAPFDPARGFAPSIRTWVLNRHPELANDAWFDEAFGEIFDDCIHRTFGGGPSAQGSTRDIGGAPG